MIINEDDPAVEKKIRDELAAHAFLKALLDAARKYEGNLRIEPCAVGLELAAEGEVKGVPNRGRLKVFFPDKTRVVAIFYKPSNLAFSRDRFSYGGILTSPSRFAQEDLQSLLDYLASGLSPSKRPSSLRRAFPYTIPE